MPRSKRQRVVTLANTQKHPRSRDVKAAHIAQIHADIDAHRTLYLFTFHNLRNPTLKALRNAWPDSALHFGRNKLTQVALGRDQATEYAKDISTLAAMLVGNVALLFTSRKHKDVVSFFENYAEPDFARSGFEATETVVLPKGPLDFVEPAQEPQLRAWGLPVRLQKGVVLLDEDFTVATAGVKLTPEMAKLLEWMGVQMAVAKLTLLARWSKKSGFKKIIED